MLAVVGIIAVALLGRLGASPQVGQARDILTRAELDATIDALPAVDEEFGEGARRWVRDAAADRLAAHLAGGGTLDHEQWRLALVRARVLRSRARWPADVPFAVGMAVPSWLPRPSRILATPARAGWQPLLAGGLQEERCGTCREANRLGEGFQELGRLDLGRHELVFSIDVERGTVVRKAPPDSPATVGEPLWSGELSLIVDVVPTLDEAVPPTHEAVLDAAVRRACAFSLYTYVHHDDVQLEFERRRVPELATISLTVELELIDAAGHTLGRLERAGGPYFSLPCAKGDLPRTSLRVRGVRGNLRRAWSAERYWDGELVIPLEELPRR